MDNWIDGFLGGKIEKEAEVSQGTDAQDHFERKVKSSSWLESVSELDPIKVEKEYQDNLAAEAKLLGKTAAYEAGDSVEETLKKDYARDVSILSNYALAEIVAGIRGHAEQNTPEMFNEHKEKAKKDVASNRKKVEDEILKATGTSAQVDWKKEFARYSKEAKPEEVKEKDLYQPIVTDTPYEFQKPSEDKFKVPSEEKKADVMIGVGREADERKEVTQQAGVLQADITEGLGKVASKFKKADYEGWKNSETWQVALWLDNDEGLNAASADLAQTIQDPNQLAEALKNLVEEAKPDLGASLWDNMINWAMAEVDWLEVASHFSSKFAESSKKDVQTKVADKVKDSPANDKGNLAMPEGKKSAGDKPVEAVEESTLLSSPKEPGDKSDQAAEANSPEKGDKAKSDEAVNKEAAKKCKVCSKPEHDQCANDPDCTCCVDTIKNASQKEAHCGSCPGDPGHEQSGSPLKREELYATAEMCPVCGMGGKCLKNNEKDNMSCTACGITYSGKEASCGHCGSQEISTHASKEDVIKMVKTAEVNSPWAVILDPETGKECIARVGVEDKTIKESEEVNKEEIQK